MRGFLTFISILFTCFLMSTGFAGVWFVYEFKRPGPLAEPTLITIRPGSGLGLISSELNYAKSIRREALFKLGVRLSGADTSLQAGEYELQPGMSMEEIMEILRDGKTFQRQFTIPEGLTSYEIVQVLNGVDNLSGEILDIPPEGILLPDTYNYHKEETRAEILTRMESAMENVVLPSCKILLERVAGSTLKDFLDKECPAPEPLKTIRDVLILASIVEKETAVAEERQRVAGVFINRLQRGIALQTDPTVIYAITGGKHDNNGKGPLGRRLLKKDLAFDNPYNTYKYPGLPPGPIANPGRASIEAVLNPEEHAYIYFVADGTGGHAFAKTLEEHNANVAQWRKIRRGQN